MQRIERKPAARINADGDAQAQIINGVVLEKLAKGILFEFQQHPYVLEAEQSRTEFGEVLRLFVTDKKKCETAVFILNKNMAEVIGNELVQWGKAT